MKMNIKLCEVSTMK